MSTHNICFYGEIKKNINVFFLAKKKKRLLSRPMNYAESEGLNQPAYLYLCTLIRAFIGIFLFHLYCKIYKHTITAQDNRRGGESTQYFFLFCLKIIML